MEPQPSLEDARRALLDAVAAEGEDEIRIDMQPMSRAALRLPPPTPAEALSALDEERLYASFAAALGIEPDEEPERYVTLPKSEYDALKADADRLPGLMRQRPPGVTPEEEQAYQEFVRQIGWR